MTDDRSYPRCRWAAEPRGVVSLRHRGRLRWLAWGGGTCRGDYLVEAGGLPMRFVESAMAVVEQGLLGDRYQTGAGEWFYDPRLYDDVTLIATEALAAARVKQGVHLNRGASRRNVETRGVDLDALVGCLFRLGEVVLRGERPCEPCRYLDRVTGQSAKGALQGRGGLRATVVSGGRLRVGDLVDLKSAVLQVGQALAVANS